MSIWVAGIAALCAGAPGSERPTDYRYETISGGITALRERFSERQLQVLEKLNRADIDHLGRLRAIVIPGSWPSDELTYTTLPDRYTAAEQQQKLLVVHLPSQAFAAYESGTLVYWGPISSGRRADQTPPGLFFLNWRSTGRASTIDSDWFMEWYFNFGNQKGLAFHRYSLPGAPASHGCIRLLERDAAWLFEWGDQWFLDETGARELKRGTPVFIVGSYDFTSPPPWQSRDWLMQTIVLPPLPATASPFVSEILPSGLGNSPALRLL